MLAYSFPPPKFDDLIRDFHHNFNISLRVDSYTLWNQFDLALAIFSSRYLDRIQDRWQAASFDSPRQCVNMPQFTTPSTRWVALQSRNPKAASAFVYCVTTTKIYCRPTCPSRLARRANIVFHDTAAEAETEGFRACKRCRPELRDGDGDPQKIAVDKACDLVRKELDGTDDRKWSVKALATEVGLTESHFCRIFKKVMGMTVGEYRASIILVNVESLSGVNEADRQHVTDVARDLTGSIPTANIPAAYGYQNCLPLADFDCPELEHDWHRFSGMVPSVAMLNYPNMDIDIIDSDQSSPDYFSDSANVDLTDDGFQFLDFDCVDSVKLFS